MKNNLSFKNKVNDLWNTNPETRDDTIGYLLSIDKFQSFQDWKKIIEVYFEIDQYFVEKHSDKIIDLIHKGQDEFSTEKVSGFLVEYLKEDSKIEFNYSNLLYLLNQEHKNANRESRKTFTKNELEEICKRRLERFISSPIKDIEKAFNILYSCWDFVDDKNIVHLTSSSLALMRSYIEELPEQYLNFIIRHQFYPINPDISGGRYIFVLEPFTKQIFKGWENYELFLKELKENSTVNRNTIECNQKFYDLFKTNKYESVPIHKDDLKLFRHCSKQIEDILKESQIN
ncbi:hypothetical protein [Maribellus sp. YY47]|uniref:hypothetical protein n=1 Tax=Maribellus sp. YY47 TaxID=2929486 RepID=UPI002000E947|nr:hypothetical protein [Maribellus sp. YY47]MCK3685985.1 hypothetical protein [Maribellus sp. YY47]